MADKSENAQPKPRFNKKLFIIVPVAVVLIAIVVYICYRGFKNREAFVFTDHLDEVAVTINGEALTYGELSFYVLYVEQKVEKEARVYNPTSSKDWWNSYVNGTFVSVSASRMAMDMAVHDYIMYKLAEDEGITLTDEEEKLVAYRQTDFFEDLYDEQLERLPVSTDEIDESIEKIAIGEKYQQKLTESLGVNNFEYNYDGYEYKQMLEKDYKVKVDDGYDKLVFGEITLHHSKVNYINGLMDN